MKTNWIKNVLICATLFMNVALFSAPVSITLENGNVWTGELDQTVTVTFLEKGKEVAVEGTITRATSDYIILDGSLIMVSDIVSISGGTESPDATNTNVEEAKGDTDKEEPDVKKPVVHAAEGGLPTGVFVLPLYEMVGTYFRPHEINQLIDHVDENYGPGQIIILDIKSGGGSVKVWSDIRDTVFNARDRHRFIAWIQSAGSGAAATAFLCDEIYYRSTGYVGSITMYSGSIENVAPDWQLYGWIKELQGVLAKTSHTPAVAGCMVKSREQFSYSIDPETGKITYFYDSSGDHVLSTNMQNLMLSPQEALDSGLSDGTADDGEQLAKLLDLEEWIEYDTFGRDIAKKWQDTLKEFEEIGPKLREQLGGDVDGQTRRQQIGNQIKAGEDLLRWAKKLGETAEMMGLHEENIVRIKTLIENLKHERQNLN
ncbi:MAG: hypothetical protein HOI88_04030 [Phycisphaerae bacterium]|jgi:hypothetical protein|nr:hypothetical protein [Phycisphaerae bacterium]MBT6282139.1 hypothetical protein [Phycisphaerae bacterium]